MTTRGAYAGFSIFYMGSDTRAFLAPVVCGYLGQRVSWHVGFAAAGVGMAAGPRAEAGALTGLDVAREQASRRMKRRSSWLLFVVTELVLREAGWLQLRIRKCMLESSPSLPLRRSESCWLVALRVRVRL